MKRGTPEHPKTKTLAKILEIPLYGAVGILEMLWHFASFRALQGDLGRWSNVQIAEAINWDREPDELINALIESGFVDKSNEYRLLIHDWHDHAEEAVKKTLRNRKLPFLTFRENSRKVDYSLIANSQKPIALITYPTQKILENWDLTQDLVDEFIKAYPGIDVLAECRRAHTWIICNPTKRKTSRGMPRFLNTWLEKVNNNGKFQIDKPKNNYRDNRFDTAEQHKGSLKD